jgi:hypothetical protein
VRRLDAVYPLSVRMLLRMYTNEIEIFLCNLLERTFHYFIVSLFLQHRTGVTPLPQAIRNIPIVQWHNTNNWVRFISGTHVGLALTWTPGYFESGYELKCGLIIVTAFTF